MKTNTCVLHLTQQVINSIQKILESPIWVNLNWIIYLGLKRYNETKLAERIKKDTIDLVSNLGFYEYFEPFKIKMKGYGGNNFSWTAALCIDFN